MKTKSGRLDRLQVPNPCPADWQQMTGDEAIRFCDTCNKQVYNLSAMTRLQAEALVSAKGGHLCIRFTRNAGGTMANSRPLSELPQPRYQITSRRASPIASAILSAIVATTPCIAVASQTPPSVSRTILSENREARPDTQPQGSTANLSGVVVDESGVAIAGATLWLTNESTSEVLQSVSSQEGKYHFEIPGKGVYILRVEAGGFEKYQTHGLSLTLANRRQMNINLRAERKVEAMGGAMALPREPLRELFTESDRVVIATIGKSVKVKKDGDSTLMRITLEVSSTLKGEPKSTVSFYESIYQDEKSEFVKGDKRLFFLQRPDEEDEIQNGYSLSGWEKPKKLSEDEARAYARHLEELATILDKDEFVLSEITEWLVRCAEDKATQADGMAELYDGMRELRSLLESKEQELNKDSGETKDEAEGEPENEGSRVEEKEISVTDIQPQEKVQISDIEIADEDVSEQAKLVLLLTESQKERLMNIIFNAEMLDDVSAELLEFAQKLKEPRLAPFLTSHLQAMQNAPTRQTFYYVSVLANLLGKQKLRDIADEFEEYEEKIQAGDGTDGDESEEVQAKPEIDEAKISQERSEFVKRFLAAVNKTLKAHEAKPKLQ